VTCLHSGHKPRRSRACERSMRTKAPRARNAVAKIRVSATNPGASGRSGSTRVTGAPRPECESRMVMPSRESLNPAFALGGADAASDANGRPARVAPHQRSPTSSSKGNSISCGMTTETPRPRYSTPIRLEPWRPDHGCNSRLSKTTGRSSATAAQSHAIATVDTTPAINAIEVIRIRGNGARLDPRASQHWDRSTALDHAPRKKRAECVLMGDVMVNPAAQCCTSSRSNTAFARRPSSINVTPVLSEVMPCSSSTPSGPGLGCPGWP